MVGAIVSCDHAAAEPLTTCTRLQFCYCADSILIKDIEANVDMARSDIAKQRPLNKAIGYISIPISTVEGSYIKLNAKIAAEVKETVETRYGKNFIWLLNTADKRYELPKGASGADYMLMWTRILEGADGSGPDFDFIYFVGPADFSKAMNLTDTDIIGQLDRYYETQSASDAALAQVDRKSFRNYYALRASVAYSVGSHDEWNIMRAINEKRRSLDPRHGIAKQLGVFFNGAPIAPALFDAAAAAGNQGACLNK
jgi:hypothetical protein